MGFPLQSPYGFGVSSNLRLSPCASLASISVEVDADFGYWLKFSCGSIRVAAVGSSGPWLTWVLRCCVGSLAQRRRRHCPVLVYMLTVTVFSRSRVCGSPFAHAVLVHVFVLTGTAVRVR